MFVYISSPYSKLPNKQNVMTAIEKFMAKYIKENPGYYPVTGLQGHYIVQHDPSMGSDWATWQTFSEKLLCISCKIIVLKLPYWEQSIGVSGELNMAKTLGLNIEYVELEDLEFEM